jgi:hypothetical protein
MFGVAGIPQQGRHVRGAPSADLGHGAHRAIDETAQDHREPIAGGSYVSERIDIDMDRAPYLSVA